MASNSAATEERDQTRGHEEDSISMVDVLQEEAQLEEDAEAILGGSDINQCTYTQGYVQRQALYACATCVKEDMEPTGVCLACSLECHEGHTLYELYTKRNFRCDCGNEKFGDMKCKLDPEKSPRNEKNHYSQNFRGLYCTCHRPYPDPDDSVEDDMIQCNLCEDWFHSRHLGRELPEEEFEEMVCDSCMAKNSFLYTYTQLHPSLYKRPVKVVCSAETTAPVNVSTEPAEVKPAETPNTQQMLSATGASTADVIRENSLAQVPESSISEFESPTKKAKQEHVPSSTSSTDTSTAVTPDKDSTENSETRCVLESLREKASSQISTGATYWPDGWRSKLCTCSKCKTMYEGLEVGFLCDLNDTLRVYTTKGNDKRPSQYEKGMAALQSMDRVKQVEVLTEFNTMKDALTEYLKTFADNKKTVRKEDIEAFYENLRANKRPRLAMPHFCR